MEDDLEGKARLIIYYDIQRDKVTARLDVICGNNQYSSSEQVKDFKHPKYDEYLRLKVALMRFHIKEILSENSCDKKYKAPRIPEGMNRAFYINL